MTSGQWTMGAMTKVKVCLPVESVSPSLTRTARESMSKSKYWRIMTSILALQTTLTSG